MAVVTAFGSAPEPGRTAVAMAWQVLFDGTDPDPRAFVALSNASTAFCGDWREAATAIALGGAGGMCDGVDTPFGCVVAVVSILDVAVDEQPARIRRPPNATDIPTRGRGRMCLADMLLSILD